MQFCDVCENMLYIHLSPGDHTRLMYHCKNCAFVRPANAANEDLSPSPDGRDQLGTETKTKKRAGEGEDENDKRSGSGSGATVVLGKNYIDDETQYEQYLKPAIKFDPTLPRLNTIECANPLCSKPAGKDNEIIYIKYDHTNLRFMYFCCYCESFWKTNRN